MDLDIIEKFFLMYLKENKIEYEFKNKIYTVKFKKEDKQIYGTEIKCTFDKKTSEDNKINLIENGNFLLDNMIEKYNEKLFFSNLIVENQKEFIDDLDNKRNEIGKQNLSFSTEEKTEEFEYYLYEILLNSTSGREKIVKSLIYNKNICVDADGIEISHLKENKEVLEIKFQEEAGDELNNIIKNKITLFEKKHFEKINELSKIIVEHSEERYKELQQKEDKIRKDINKLREEIIRASTFNKKQTLTDKQKQLHKKLENLINKNKTKKAQLKKEHDFEQLALKSRDYSIHAKIIGVAKIKMPIFYTKYSDKSKYVYFPALNKIFNSKGQNVESEKEIIKKEKEIKREFKTPKVNYEKINQKLNKKVEFKKEITVEKKKISKPSMSNFI
ncbi:hypothetical protein HOC99_02020 [Candidatus Woesearchaeota archaeon]|nr:hypothetical protein [Candidatus Woesearchaeota archaeon]MBT4595686.1 hypothetical protein [Candidatus Woesearchaeota archaeon]MBT7962244.1 hypothetical protein [Candidatus Woesearchaeota archaeon]